MRLAHFFTTYTTFQAGRSSATTWRARTRMFGNRVPS